MLDNVECTIRLLEVEAETSETQAKRFAELASYTNAPEHKLKLEALSAEPSPTRLMLGSSVHPPSGSRTHRARR